MPSPAFARFFASTLLTYAQWHDGLGYDLEALDQLDPDEKAQVEDFLTRTATNGWRELEALDRLATPRSIDAMKSALACERLEVSIDAATRLAARGILAPHDVESVLLRALPKATIADGLVVTLRLAQLCPTDAVKRELVRCALHGQPDARVHAAALAEYLSGVSSAPFDWNRRSIYLDFGSRWPWVRRRAHRALCARTGVAR